MTEGKIMFQKKIIPKMKRENTIIQTFSLATEIYLKIFMQELLKIEADRVETIHNS